MSGNKLKFHNGVFTVLQVSDAQDLQYVRRTMLWMLGKAYDRVQPDLVLLTGDNPLGNHFRDAMSSSSPTAMLSTSGQTSSVQWQI